MEEIVYWKDFKTGQRNRVSICVRKDPAKGIDYSFIIVECKIYGVKVNTHLEGDGRFNGIMAYTDLLKKRVIHV